MSRRLVVINKTTDFRDLRDLYHKRKRERSLQSVRSVVPPKTETEIKRNWFIRFIWNWHSRNVIDKNQTNQIHPFPLLFFSVWWNSPSLSLLDTLPLCWEKGISLSFSSVLPSMLFLCSIYDNTIIIPLYYHYNTIIIP